MSRFNRLTKSVSTDLAELRRLLAQGSIQRAYRALLSYMTQLRTHFMKNAAAGRVSELYQGALDVSFFAVFPPSLARRRLKVVVLFNYKAFRFEAWLAGRNRQVQKQYWQLLKERDWPDYRLRTPAKGVDAILECDLATDVDFDDPEALTASIAAAVDGFVKDVERTLARRSR